MFLRGSLHQDRATGGGARERGKRQHAAKPSHYRRERFVNSCGDGSGKSDRNGSPRRSRHTTVAKVL